MTLWMLAAATITTIGLLYLLDPLAKRLNLIDYPWGRKQHSQAVPLTGGLAMFFTFAAFTPFVVVVDYSELALLIAMLLVVGKGVIDDFYDLGPHVRLLLQIGVASVLIVGGGSVVTHLGHISGDGLVELGWLATPFSLLCLVGLLNAMNMLDGLDGLAGGTAFVMLGWLIIVAWLADATAAFASHPMLLQAVILGFLIRNLPWLGMRPASVFMGDAGSMLLAVGLGYFAIDIAFGHGSGVPPITIAWILALPVIDTLCVMAWRTRQRQSPLHADRHHIHHYLLWAGLSPLATVWLLIGLAGVTGAIGVGGWQLGVPEWLLFIGFVGLTLFWMFGVRHFCRVLRGMLVEDPV